jgi:hypothetical protein
MHDTVIVITQEMSLEQGREDYVIASAMDASHGIEWDYWEVRQESIFIEELTEAHMGGAAAVIADGVWYGRTFFLPWKAVGECFIEAEYPPLDWVKNQGKFATFVNYHH